MRFAAADVRYLRRIIFHMDDDFGARLLGVKLGVAQIMSGRCPADVVRVGSDIVYSLEGRAHHVRIVHGVCASEISAGVGSRMGATLIGFSAGQSLLWPLEGARLAQLKILKAVQRPALFDAARTSLSHRGLACVSG